MPLPDDVQADDTAAGGARAGAGAGRGVDAGAGAHGPDWQVVHLHPSAPPQPAQGAPCNGCGLCCLAEPCPLGMLVSRRRHGPCAALRWREEGAGGDAAPGRYVCGMVADPGEVTGWRSAWAVRLMRALARRWIAAGIGCDAPPLRVPEGAVHPQKDPGNLL
ncbi:hypothetical protein AVHY2522_07595 [Acidovorax sp. SUPP2522]|nr:hypothetical protein AVHY2522_07595 [Acidovorax sp. SUPP2522]